jgi:hypothetical protein
MLDFQSGLQKLGTQLLLNSDRAELPILTAAASTSGRRPWLRPEGRTSHGDGAWTHHQTAVQCAMIEKWRTIKKAATIKESAKRTFESTITFGTLRPNTPP